MYVLQGRKKLKTYSEPKKIPKNLLANFRVTFIDSASIIFIKIFKTQIQPNPKNVLADLKIYQPNPKNLLADLKIYQPNPKNLLADLKIYSKPGSRIPRFFSCPGHTYETTS